MYPSKDPVFSYEVQQQQAGLYTGTKDVTTMWFESGHFPMLEKVCLTSARPCRAGSRTGGEPKPQWVIAIRGLPLASLAAASVASASRSCHRSAAYLGDQGFARIELRLDKETG